MRVLRHNYGEFSAFCRKVFWLRLALTQDIVEQNNQTIFLQAPKTPQKAAKKGGARL